MRFSILIVTLLCAAKSSHSFSDFLSNDIIDRINSLNTTWKAGKNFDESSLLKITKLFMSSNETLTPIREGGPFTSPGSEQLESFDLRNSMYSKNCKSIGQIFDQGFCSPSWLYASVSQIADYFCIDNGKPIDVEATVKHMLKDNYDCNSEYNSADVGKAFEYWKEKGIFITEQKTCLPFSEKCSPHNGKIYSYRKLDYFQSRNGSEFNSLSNGPIVFNIDVYVDLLYYKSGVYQRTSNVKLGSHAVKVIGWGTENGVDYWLVANSWGTKWGDEGFFKLKRGDNGLEVKQSIVPYLSFDEYSDKVVMEKQQIFLKTPKETSLYD